MREGGRRSNQKENIAVNIEHAKPRWPFYLLWIAVMVLGIPVAFFLTLVVLRLIIQFVGGYITVGGVRHITEDFLGRYIFVPVVGLLTGLLQFALLRRYLPRMGGWAAATIGGWLLGLLVITAANRLHWSGPFSTFAALGVVGLSIGAAQWLLLRRRVRRAGWWVAANAAGWALLSLFSAANSIGLYGLLMIGILPACATAATLALLMNQAARAEATSS